MRSRCAALLAFFIATLPVSSANSETSINVQSQVISNLDLRDKNHTRFGEFNFVGGLVLRSNNPDFGGISALHVTPDNKITAISDSGFWFTAQLNRGENGHPLAFSQTIIAPILNSNGEQFENKWLADAEGMAVGKDKIYISMEQNSRILWFPTSGDTLKQPSQLLSGAGFTETLRTNFALEAIATPSHDSNLPYDLVAISEFSPNENGHARAFFRQSGVWKEFQIPLVDRYLITDAAFTPSGELLILERRFSLATGARARVRQLNPNDISEGALVDGKVVLDLNTDQQIDNMEGISVFKSPAGKTKLALISDNNQFPLQRTLYLEFEWSEIAN